MMRATTPGADSPESTQGSSPTYPDHQDYSDVESRSSGSTKKKKKTRVQKTHGMFDKLGDLDAQLKYLENREMLKPLVDDVLRS